MFTKHSGDVEERHCLSLDVITK